MTRMTRREPFYLVPSPALLPATDWVRRATIKAYQLGGITDKAARLQLETHCGMSAADAARCVADAIEVKA